MKETTKLRKKFHNTGKYYQVMKLVSFSARLDRRFLRKGIRDFLRREIEFERRRRD